MPSPYRSLPPLAALRTFEAVARQLSFTRAADELALTQSAVSHQIRALEDHLGTSLFGRLHRGIELTDEGRVLLEGVRAGLDTVLLASERVRSRGRVGVLTVAAPAAFATWWLVPRLGRFAALHPEIEVRIAAMDGREPDLWRDGVDIAVVKRPAPVAERIPGEMALLREIVFPVCAPSLIGGGLPLHTVRDLGRQTLIECETAEAEDLEFSWSTWLARFGLARAQGSRQLRFSHFGLALSAAIDGLGVALGRSPMVDAELAAGRLVRPFGKKVVAKAANVFALTWRTTDASFADQRIVAFRDFALDEACGCELAAGPCGMPESERDARARAGWVAGRAARRALTLTGGAVS
ncbi:MAG TPA: LysR family transcriptional regulator [Stellaceae bacterium]|jgi:LysR family transcriptional regulator, glycine cleavage system transcriptional activator|nr:LysR family transcriptional regulator [Stellaceae bacterium]